MIWKIVYTIRSLNNISSITFELPNRYVKLHHVEAQLKGVHSRFRSIGCRQQVCNKRKYVRSYVVHRRCRRLIKYGRNACSALVGMLSLSNVLNVQIVGLIRNQLLL